jgi:pyruvate dehydrogenase (quinone)
MLGFKGIFVDSPDRLASAWQEALISDRPVVIEVKTDPEVVPLPPHVTLQQARGFMSSMIKGDEATGHIISETAKQVFGGLFGTKEEPKQRTGRPP